MSARHQRRRSLLPPPRVVAGLTLVVLSLVALGPAPAGAQAVAASVPDTILVRETLPLRVRDVGPGRPGRMLRSALERPYVAFGGDSTRRLSLRRDTAFASTVVVLGRDATVASRVAGDVIVIGGDLFLHPGATIEGRAIAYGGAVYNSTLATVRGGVFSYRDLTFDRVRGPDEISLRYRDLELFHVPLIGFAAFGFHLPEYTRVDGAVIPWGPTITLAEGGVEIVPTVTYRSHLGAVDPAVAGALRYGRRNRLEGEVGRGTFSNDRWIRSNLLNTITTLFAGTDTRNYFRADRAELRASRMWETERTVVEPFVGARVERGWSVGPDSVTEHAPWSLLRRGSREAMLRFNPPVARGRIASALVGGRLDFEEATLRAGRPALHAAHVGRGGRVPDVPRPDLRVLRARGDVHGRRAAAALGVPGRQRHAPHAGAAGARRGPARLRRQPLPHPDRSHRHPVRRLAAAHAAPRHRRRGRRRRRHAGAERRRAHRARAVPPRVRDRSGIAGREVRHHARLHPVVAVRVAFGRCAPYIAGVEIARTHMAEAAR